jgi:hypothetical protein
MLAILLNVPKSPADWERWAFHHRQSHDAIRGAINRQLNIDLPDYVLYPIADFAPKNFLENNQNAHVDMNQALARPASDLSELDFQNDHQLRAWIYLHWQEHNVAENALRIGT